MYWAFPLTNAVGAALLVLVASALADETILARTLVALAYAESVVPPVVLAARLVDATDTTDERDCALLSDLELSLALEDAAFESLDVGDADPVDDTDVDETEVNPVMAVIVANSDDNDSMMDETSLSGAVALARTLSRPDVRLSRAWRSSRTAGSGAAMAKERVNI